MVSAATGEAARAASRGRVEAALVRMLPTEMNGGHLTVISGGYTNLNWQLLGASGTRYFVKDPGPAGSPFINRATAREAAGIVGALGIAPRMLDWDSATGIEIHAFLDGFRSVTPADMRGPLAGRVMETYRRAHGAGLLSETKTGLDQIAQHRAQLAEAGVALPRSWARVAAGLDEATRALLAAGIDLSLCYNDGHISNYLIDDAGRLQVIDWEYAANNDRYWDVGLFALEMFFEPREVVALIEAYDGRCLPDIYARVQVWRLLAGIKWALWALIQAHGSPLAFDFRKYAEVLFDRIGFEMGLPAWQAWLKDL